MTSGMIKILQAGQTFAGHARTSSRQLRNAPLAENLHPPAQIRTLRRLENLPVPHKKPTMPHPDPPHALAPGDVIDDAKQRMANPGWNTLDWTRQLPDQTLHMDSWLMQQPNAEPARVWRLRPPCWGRRR